MTLTDIKAECERDEAKMDGLHSTVDKFTKEGDSAGIDKSQSLKKWQGISTGKAAAIIVSAVVVAAALVFVFMSQSPGDKEANAAPTIDSWSIDNGMNGLRILINASDSDNNISAIYIQIYANETPLGLPVLEEVYFIHNRTASVSDLLNVNSLSIGSYLIRVQAVDDLGRQSAFNGSLDFNVPAGILFWQDFY